MLVYKMVQWSILTNSPDPNTTRSKNPVQATIPYQYENSQLPGRFYRHQSYKGPQRKKPSIELLQVHSPMEIIYVYDQRWGVGYQNATVC